MFELFKFSQLLEADKGKGGAGDPPPGTPPGDPPGKKDGEGDQGGKKPDADGKGGKGGEPGQGDKQFTQADLDRIVTERLDRERKAREKEAEKVKTIAEQKALEDEKKWQELAEKQKTQIADFEKSAGELTTLKDTHAKYEKALKAYLETQRKGLPDHIVKLLDKLDPVEQLEYIAANAEALNKPKSNIPPTPDSKDPKDLDEAQKAEAQKQSDRGYRNLFR
jgi:hypothetical protein